MSCNLTLLNDPIINVLEDNFLETNSKDDCNIDPLSSLFSPSPSIGFNLSSPMTPLSTLSTNNEQLQDIQHLTTNRNSLSNSRTSY